MCGMTVDTTMFSYDIVTLPHGGAISLSPEYPVQGATYSIYPALPSSAQMNSATGAITGTTAAFNPFSSFTIIQNNSGVRTKFYLTVILDGEAPSVDPSAQPTSQPVEPTIQPTVQPSDEPSVQPTVQPSVQPSIQPEPTEEPSGDSATPIIITVVIVVVVVVVVIVVIAISCCRKGKKTMPTKPLPVVYLVCSTISHKLTTTLRFFTRVFHGFNTLDYILGFSYTIYW